jgi:hypothetical protein
VNSGIFQYLFVFWKVVFFWKVNFMKVNFKKVNYFSMFGSVMKNKLENIFRCLVMSWKMSCKITY